MGPDISSRPPVPSRRPRAATPPLLATVLPTLVAAALVLSACADATGGVDELGHNGYDVMTCEQAKALALDAQYRAVQARSAQTRLAELAGDAAKAADPSVREATAALIAGVRRDDPRAVRAASASLVSACRLDRPVVLTPP